MRDILLLAGSTVTMPSQATGQRVAWSLAGLGDSVLGRGCGSYSLGVPCPAPSNGGLDLNSEGRSVFRGRPMPVHWFAWKATATGLPAATPPSPGGIVEGTRKGTDAGSGQQPTRRRHLSLHPSFLICKKRTRRRPPD